MSQGSRPTPSARASSFAGSAVARSSSPIISSTAETDGALLVTMESSAGFANPNRRALSKRNFRISAIRGVFSGARVDRPR